MTEERRVVTLLFADIMGSTLLGETSDPEDVRAVLGRYYEIAKEVVIAHGGTVEKFIGDAVLAIFGLQRAHGDDPERALAAALALRAAVASDPETAALTLRIGINTGEVVANRDPERQDFLVTGDAVNVAARLQQHAEPGTILVGARTRAAAIGAFAFSAERDLQVKGKSAALRASELEAKLAQRRPVRSAPFIGRGDDVAQLELVAKRAFDERRPQLVTITAPAGTGKSRLVQELVARLNPGVLIATAQCLPYGSVVTYLPLRSLAATLLGTGSDSTVQNQAMEALVEAGHPPEDARRIAGLVAATLGERETEEHDRDQLFGAWRVLLETFAARASLIVVFEDLHWASDSLIDLVEHLTVPRTSAPLLMIALARPELLDRRPTWGGGRPNFTAIGLEPLSQDETRTLVEALTVNVPTEMASRIAKRSGGNPFFAGELVRAHDERRQAGASDEEIVLPDTVRATILARLDALPHRERTVVQRGAVIGPTVRPAALGRLVPFGSAETAAALLTLADQQFLTVDPDGYAFTHDLIREVAYATLSRADRVRAHVALAGWIEDEAVRQGTELTELVAYHYRQAIGLTPGERLPKGLDLGRVVFALERAARLAANGGAIEEAAVQLREAIRLSPAQDHERLYALLGNTVRTGDDAAGGYTETLARWRARPADDKDPQVGARLLIRLALVYVRLAGSLRKLPTRADLDALLAEAVPLVAASRDPALTAGLACAEAFHGSSWLVGSEDLARLERAVSDGARFFAAEGDRRSESEALDALANLYRESDQLERAVEATRSRLVRPDELDLFERSDAWGVLVMDLVRLGRFDDALEAHAAAIGQVRVGEPEHAFNHASAGAAVAAEVSGQWDRCLAICDSLRRAWEDSLRSRIVGRQVVRGFVAGLCVAIARADSARAAQYRGAILAVANLTDLPADHWYRAYIPAVIDRRPSDVEAAIATIGRSDPEALARVIAIAVFEADVTLDDHTLARAATTYTRTPPTLAHRIALARALSAEPEPSRIAIANAAAAGLAGDAARALALVGIRTDDAAMIDDARRRLTALNDRLYLDRLPVV